MSGYSMHHAFARAPHSERDALPEPEPKRVRFDAPSSSQHANPQALPWKE